MNRTNRTTREWEPRAAASREARPPNKIFHQTYGTDDKRHFIFSQSSLGMSDTIPHTVTTGKQDDGTTMESTQAKGNKQKQAKKKVTSKGRERRYSRRASSCEGKWIWWEPILFGTCTVLNAFRLSGLLTILSVRCALHTIDKCESSHEFAKSLRVWVWSCCRESHHTPRVAGELIYY